MRGTLKGIIFASSIVVLSFVACSDDEAGGTIWTSQEIDSETDNCVSDGFGEEEWCRCIAEGFSRRYSYDTYLTEIKWSSDTVPEDQAIIDKCDDLFGDS